MLPPRLVVGGGGGVVVVVNDGVCDDNTCAACGPTDGNPVVVIGDDCDCKLMQQSQRAGYWLLLVVMNT